MMTCRYHNRVKGGYYCRWFGTSVGKECGDCDGYRDPKPKGEQRHISEHPHAVKGCGSTLDGDAIRRVIASGASATRPYK
jgi:hypothetical protein